MRLSTVVEPISLSFLADSVLASLILEKIYTVISEGLKDHTITLA